MHSATLLESGRGDTVLQQLEIAPAFSGTGVE